MNRNLYCITFLYILYKIYTIKLFYFKTHCNINFKFIYLINYTDLFKFHTLWSQFWKEISYKNDEEFNYILNLLFPQIQKKRSGLFDCPPFYHYINTSIYSSGFVFPDSSFYRWYKPNDIFLKDHDRVLLKTKEFQNKLFHHQNPPKCEGKRYLEIPLNNWGLGSVMIHLARYISMIINHGYIAIIPKSQWIWTSQTYFCNNDTSFTCIFEEISNCTKYYYNFYKPKLNFTIPSNKYPSPFFYPLWVEDLLKDTPYYKSPQTYYFYSVAQILGYLLRPSSKVLHWMNEYKKTDTINEKIDVAIHIRHGDKGSEMKLVPTLDYLHALRVIQKIEKRDALNVFISTEDQTAIDLLKNNTKNFKIYYFHHKRVNGGYKEFSKDATNVCLYSLLNLRECLNAKYFIGTSKSCWSFLVYAMRNTVGFNDNSFFFEVGQDKCLSVCHCKIIYKDDVFPHMWGTLH